MKFAKKKCIKEVAFLNFDTKILNYISYYTINLNHLPYILSFTSSTYC